MSDAKQACIVYTPATANQRQSVRARLEQHGFVVTECEASESDAKAAEAGSPDIPPNLLECILAAAVCIFLISSESDVRPGVGIGAGIGAGNSAGKRVVVVLADSCASLPTIVDDLADAVVQIDSENIGPAAGGADAWEIPGQSGTPRKVERVKCQ